MCRNNITIWVKEQRWQSPSSWDTKRDKGRQVRGDDGGMCTFFFPLCDKNTYTHFTPREQPQQAVGEQAALSWGATTEFHSTGMETVTPYWGGVTHTHMQTKHTANSIRVCAGYNLHSGLIIYNVSCVTSLCLPGERAAAVGDTPLGEIPRHILGPCFVSSANHWDFFTTCRTIVVSSPRPHLSCQQLLNKNSTNFTHQSLCRGVRLHMRHKPV